MSVDPAKMPTLTALHLTVNNHPGVMSHVCGLFARRAFNLEGIFVAPSPANAPCSMWLLVNEDQRMPQILSQVRKLHDVLEVKITKNNPRIFGELADSCKNCALDL